MNDSLLPVFATRSTTILELPLAKPIRILHPEQVILKIGTSYHDLGASCYASRSNKSRKRGRPRDVVLSSFLKQRPSQISQLIKLLSSLVTDGGKRMLTVQAHATLLKMFLDWADATGRHDCLAGGDATRLAYWGWAKDARERYLRQEIGKASHNHRLDFIRTLLQAMTGLEDLHRGTRRLKERGNANGGTDPLAPHDFAHAVALNQALFDGLCELVLEEKHFPYKLTLPLTLGWTENHLWCFPIVLWRLPPHQWGAEREKRANPNWAYDYANGRLATPGEIAHRYAIGRFRSSQRKTASKVIGRARNRIKAANADARHRVRIMLGMFAHNAFLFLFICNTGANESVVREIETDGEIDTATLNQRYRSIKFRAGGKPVTVVVPATFMPSLRRFMDLRRYLLGAKTFPYLFFTLGHTNTKPPGQLGLSPIYSLYKNLLRTIDPQLPRIGSRKLRASVADWYQRHHDAKVAAKVLQNSELTAQKRYDAGSATDHREELSLFLNSVSECAKRQRVIPITAVSKAYQFEEGGHCDRFGHPEPLADCVPVKPNCMDGQGCLFCTHRVLIACEEDVRRVASAAFVMEQLIFGPKHEESFRPLIAKCDEDLEKIAAFGNCRAMVAGVRKDVFENGNLTPFFADKFQLFLELGVIT